MPVICLMFTTTNNLPYYFLENALNIFIYNLLLSEIINIACWLQNCNF